MLQCFVCMATPHDRIMLGTSRSAGCEVMTDAQNTNALGVRFTYGIMVYLRTLSTAQATQRWMVGWFMHNELVMIGRNMSWYNSRYYPGICLEGLRKGTKSLSQDSRSPGRDFKPGFPKYKAGMLTTRPRRYVIGEIRFRVHCDRSADDCVRLDTGTGHWERCRWTPNPEWLLTSLPPW
jgi:hypothetical protein